MELVGLIFSTEVPGGFRMARSLPPNGRVEPTKKPQVLDSLEAFASILRDRLRELVALQGLEPRTCGL
jgi:hypothetical protein